jgi:hypothetical protein
MAQFIETISNKKNCTGLAENLSYGILYNLFDYNHFLDCFSVNLPYTEPSLYYEKGDILSWQKQV